MPAYKIDVAYGDDIRTLRFNDTRTLEILAQEVAIKGGIMLTDITSSVNEDQPAFIFLPHIISIAHQ